MSFNYVARAFSRDLGAHLRGYEPGSHASRLAFKAALACVLSVLAGLYLELPQIHWGAFTALIVTRPVAGATLEKSLLRILGTVAGAALGVVFAGLAAYSQAATFCILFFITALSVWGAAAFPRVSYSFFLGGITSLIVLLGTLAEPGQAFYMAYYRAFEICVGIACSLFVNVVLLPDLAGPLLKRNAAGCLGIVRTLVRMTVRDYGGGRYRADRFNALKAALDARLDAYADLARGAKVEGTVNREELALARDLASKLGHISDMLAAFYRQAGHGNETAWPLLDKDILDETHEGFREFARQAAAFLCARPNPGGIARAVDRFHRAVDGLAASYRQSRGGKAHLDTPVADVVRFHQFIRCFKAVATILDLEPGAMPGAAKPAAANPLSPGYRPMLKQITVCSLAMVLVPMLWIELGIPGLAEMAVSVAIILQPGDVETERKAFLRVAGCMAGGCLGLLFLGSQAVQFFWVWLFAYFISIYFFSYINFGKDTFSYFGLQGCLALTMAFIQGRGPAAGLAPPVERLAAILLAAVIIVILGSLILPDPPGKQLRRALDGCGDRIERLLALLAEGAIPPEAPVRETADSLKHATAFAWRRLGTVEMLARGEDRTALESAKRYLYACDLMRVNVLALLDASHDGALDKGLAEWGMHPERVLEKLPAIQASDAPGPGLEAAHRALRRDLDRRREQTAEGKRPPLETALDTSAYYLAVSGVVDALELAAEARPGMALSGRPESPATARESRGHA